MLLFIKIKWYWILLTILMQLIINKKPKSKYMVGYEFLTDLNYSNNCEVSKTIKYKLNCNIQSQLVYKVYKRKHKHLIIFWSV